MKNCIIAKEAQIFIKQNIDGAMHDASEGGIFAALWDMAEYSGTGLDIDLREYFRKTGDN